MAHEIVEIYKVDDFTVVEKTFQAGDSYLIFSQGDYAFVAMDAAYTSELFDALLEHLGGSPCDEEDE